MVISKQILGVSLLCFAVQVFAASVSCTTQKTKPGLSYCTTLSVGTGTIVASGTLAKDIWASVYNSAKNVTDSQYQNIINLFNDKNIKFMTVYNAIQAGTVPSGTDVNNFYNDISTPPIDASYFLYVKNFANYLIGHIK